jgi:hypothetical protein
MKKIIMFFISVLLFQLGVFAQASFSQTASNPTGAITNTSVDTMTYTTIRSNAIVSIQPVVTKSSGTMTGWAVLDYSVDGTTWYVGTDSLSLANVTTNTIVWNKQVAARYFRIRVGGATSVGGTCIAKVVTTQ